MVRALLILSALSLAGCDPGPDQWVDLLGENAFAGDISKDGRIIVMGGSKRGVRLFVDGRETHTLHKNDGVVAIEDAALSPNATRIATASGNQYAVFSVESGRKLKTGSAPALIKSIAVDNQGSVLLGTLAGAYWLTGNDNLQLSPQATRAVALDGRRGVIGNDQGQVSLWWLGDRRPVRQWQMGGPVESVALEDDQLAAATRDQPTRLMSVGGQATDAELPQESSYYPTPVGVVSIRITRDGVWTGNNLKRAAFWSYQDLSQPAQIWRMPVRGGANPGSARILGFSRDEKKPVAIVATGHRVELVRD